MRVARLKVQMLAESLQMSEQGKRVMVCAFLVLDYGENFIKMY